MWTTRSSSATFKAGTLWAFILILEDERCWFLAADFDKATWVEDVAAFVDTCRRVGVPAAVERSRSGNGAHVWFFFSEPVPVAMARKMGCYLITETSYRFAADSPRKAAV